YELETDGMDDDSVRSELRATDALAHDEDDFEEGTKEFERRKQLEAEEAARVAAQETELEARASGTPQALQVHNTGLPKSGDHGKCPHCSAYTRDGEHVSEF